MSLFEVWVYQYHSLFSIISAVTPLGMEDGSIADEQITASSCSKHVKLGEVNLDFIPGNGRLNNANGF